MLTSPACPVYRGFWSVFILISVAAVALGGFLILCAAPFASHCLYKVGGGLFLTSGEFNPAGKWTWAVCTENNKHPGVNINYLKRHLCLLVNKSCGLLALPRKLGFCQNMFVCLAVNSKSCRWIWIKFLGNIHSETRNILEVIQFQDPGPGCLGKDLPSTSDFPG